MQNVVWPEDFVAVFCIDNEKTPMHRMIKKKKVYRNNKSTVAEFQVHAHHIFNHRRLYGT